MSSSVGLVEMLPEFEDRAAKDNRKTSPSNSQTARVPVAEDYGASGASDTSSPARRTTFFSRLSSMTADTAPAAFKLFFAVAYAVASVAIMMVVKIVLTQYEFRSFEFVAALQYLCAVCIQLLQRNVTHTIPAFPLHDFWHNMLVVLFPLPLLFVANTLSGLGASRDLSMPTFVMMRRVSIAMTMLLEWLILRKKPTKMVVLSVGLMIFAAVVGTGFKLSGSLKGMAMVHVNNLLTALQGVFLRKKIDDVASVLTSDGILFYNNMFAFICAAAPIVFNVDGRRDMVLQYDGWSNGGFLFALFLSSIMGFVLSYSTMMCTKLNSPLTTAMVGAAKNTVTSYIGMLFKDYSFNMWNFTGVNIGVVGTILYSKIQIDKLRPRLPTSAVARRDPSPRPSDSERAFDSSPVNNSNGNDKITSTQRNGVESVETQRKIS